MNIYIKTVLFSIAISACTPGQLAPIEQSSDVYGASLGNFKLTNPTLVCWQDEGEVEKKAWVRQAIINSWSKYAEIDFLGWELCSDLSFIDRENAIRLGWERKCNILSDFDCRGVSGWAKIGYYPESIIDNLRFSYNAKIFYSSPEGEIYTKETIENTAVHEFGHLLGFMHEHQRIDAPDCGLEVSDPSLQHNYTKKKRRLHLPYIL